MNKYDKQDLSWIEKSLIWVTAIGGILVLLFGIMLGMTWVTVLVLSGFGIEIPFWPTFGAWFILHWALLPLKNWRKDD